MARCNRSIHSFTSISLTSNSSYFHFQGAAAHCSNPSPVLSLDHGSGGQFAAPTEGCRSSWNWLIFAGQIKIIIKIAFKFHAPPAGSPLSVRAMVKATRPSSTAFHAVLSAFKYKRQEKVKIEGALDGKPNKLSLLTESPWYDKSTSNMFQPEVLENQSFASISSNELFAIPEPRHGAESPRPRRVPAAPAAPRSVCSAEGY